MACCSVRSDFATVYGCGLVSQDRWKSRLRVCAVASSNGKEGNVQVEQQSLGSKQDMQVQQQTQQARGSQPVLRRRRTDSPLALLDYWNPFSSGGLRQVIDLIDSFVPDAVPPSPISQGGDVWLPWDVVEDDEGYHVRVDMPGFGKENVKVSVEDGVLVIAGERDPSMEDERWAAKSYHSFNARLALPDDARMEDIKAELKNGVLCVTVPKKRREEKQQVIDVQVS